jgi:hypothetical protein
MTAQRDGYQKLWKRGYGLALEVIMREKRNRNKTALIVGCDLAHAVLVLLLNRHLLAIELIVDRNIQISGVAIIR